MMISKMFGNSFFFIILLYEVLQFAVFAKVAVKSGYTLVKVHDSTYLECSVSPPDDCILWTHHRPKRDRHDNSGDREIYNCDSGVNIQFMNRFHVDRNISTGKAVLSIKHVVMEDAGTYECQGQNGYGERKSVEVFVIDGDPKCEPSVPLHQVIGQNDCGIQPDNLTLTCSVSYNGPTESQPILEWRKFGNNHKLDQTCEAVDNRLSCTIRIHATLHLNRTEYICTTTQSVTSQYSCTTEPINVLYAFKTRFEQYVDMPAKLVCEVARYHDCTYTWKRFPDIEDGWEESNGRVFSPEMPGSYRCETTCAVRNRTCNIFSKVVHVSAPSGEQEQLLSSSSHSLLRENYLLVIFCRWFLLSSFQHVKWEALVSIIVVASIFHE